MHPQVQNLFLDYASNPETTACNLLFYPLEQLCEYVGDSKQAAERRAQCVAELFAREFLKKGNAKTEINAVLTDDELARFWSRIGEDFLDIHETRTFPLDVLWDSTSDFSRICEITVRERLRELCEDTDGFIPVYLGKQAYFIPFHFEKQKNHAESGSIVDLAGNPIPLWQAPYARLFPEGKYRCIVRCDQSGLLQGNRQKNVFTGNSLMLPLYLAFLRREEKLEYNPLRLIATGEIDTTGRLKPVETAEKAKGFHLSFDNSSYFVYPESTKYSSTERNELALPKLELEQIEEYFRVRGLFVKAKPGREETVCSICPAMSKSFVGRWEELMNLNKQIRGHTPVITGEAGVGKTELAVAYADLYSENFPQGRFMIPMQGIHSWTDAMIKMIEWCNVCGIMPEQLGLPEDYNKLPPEEKRKTAYRMLSFRAKKGALLLLLDNLEELSLISESGLRELTGPAGLSANLHVYATTRIREKRGLAVQTPMEIGNLKERDALDLFCKICGNTLQEQVQNIEQEHAALHEIIGLLKGHAWSLEIVAGRFASHVREFGKDEIRRERDELQKNLTDTLKGKTHRSVENDAEILLRPTINLILKNNKLVDGLGNKIMRLADFASFFPPEQIPEYALGGLWKQEFGDNEITIELDGTPSAGKAYDYAKTQLKNCRIINGDEPMFKMHRLTREVLQKHLSEGDILEQVKEMRVYLNAYLKDNPEPRLIQLQPWCGWAEERLNKMPCCNKDIAFLNSVLALVDSCRKVELYKNALDILEHPFMPQPQDNLFAAKLLRSRGLLFSDYNRTDEAETCFRESLSILREFVKKTPEYKSLVAKVFNDLAVLHKKLNRWDEAETEFSESLSYCDSLSENATEEHCVQRALILNNYGGLLDSLDRPEEAKAIYSESLSIYRKLAKIKPVYMAEVARVLCNFGRFLYRIDECKESEAALKESLSRFRILSEKNPDVYLYRLANVIDGLAILYMKQAHYENAESMCSEALSVYRKLSEKNPEIYLSEEASALHNKGFLLYKKKNYKESEDLMKKSVLFCRKLVEKNPDIYSSRLANELNNLANVYLQTNCIKEAELRYFESVSIYRKLAEKYPEKYLSAITGGLHNIGLLHFKQKRFEEAKTECLESVSGYRKLAENNPDLYLSYLANSLNNLASVYMDANDFEEAELTRSESLSIYRKLAEKNPDVYLSHVANVLGALAVIHEKLNRADDAERERQEAASIREKQKKNT